jgi:7-cyano-7-deazaguanine synthase
MMRSAYHLADWIPTVCLCMLRERGLIALPVYVNYDQRNLEREWGALLVACTSHGFPEPVRFDFPSFGSTIKSGLTDATLRVNEDAFTPTRNLLFLVLAGVVARSRGVGNIVIGLLSESTAIFPDQTDRFLKMAEDVLTEALGVHIGIHWPLRDLTKRDVLTLLAHAAFQTSIRVTLGVTSRAGNVLPVLNTPEGGRNGWWWRRRRLLFKRSGAS